MGVSIAPNRPKLLAGTSIGYFTAVAGRHWELRDGTVAAPVTQAAPSMHVSRTQRLTRVAIEAVGGVGTDGGELNAAVVGVSQSASTSDEGMPVGLYGAAIQKGTGGGNFNDSIGVYGAARSQGSAQGLAIALYGHAWRDSSSGKALAAELQIRNDGANGSYSATAAPATGGVWIYANWSADPAVGVAVGNPFGNQFDVGFAVLGQVGGGDTGAAKTAAFRDDSNATASLEQRGTHTYGIDQQNGTFSTAALHLNGHVLFKTSGTFDIGSNTAGANGGSVPRDIWMSGSVRAGGVVQANAGLRATGDLGSNAASTTMIVHTNSGTALKVYVGNTPHTINFDT